MDNFSLPMETFLYREAKTLHQVFYSTILMAEWWLILLSKQERRLER